MTYKIAVDVMGSDDAPKTELAGIKLALAANKDLTVIAFGLQSAIEQVGFTHERLTYIYSEDVITGNDQAATAFRIKKNASMIQAIQYVKDGYADAVVSSGNTGAYITSALFMLGRIKGVKRPALISPFPTKIKGKKIIFGDMGAVADADAETIAQNGVLVSEIAKILLDIKTPTVGLLNIGSEEKKGSEAYIEAHQLMQNNQHIKFKGNVEARYLMDGGVDAIAAGGFAGNIALKSYEGAIAVITGTLKSSIMNAGIFAKLGGLLIKSALKEMKAVIDYESIGGAIVAGIKAPVIKAHGTTTDLQIASAIELGKQFVEKDLVGNIALGITQDLDK